MTTVSARSQPKVLRLSRAMTTVSARSQPKVLLFVRRDDLSISAEPIRVIRVIRGPQFVVRRSLVIKSDAPVPSRSIGRRISFPA